ncbi:heavy metal translocating P-type ATPase, partial [Salinispira pacifica]
LVGAYLLVGAPVLISAARNIVRGRVFDEMFLMTVATLGAILIHQLPEAAAVMLFYSIGEYVQDLAVDRSRRSIKSLVDLRPESARILSRDGERTLAPPERVETGEVIEVLPGERIPLDGEIISGESEVDTSALTGESVPRSVSHGDLVLAGFVNDAGRLTIRVTKPFSQSSISRILALVEDAAARKAPTERFISRFATVYTPIVVAVAAVIAFVPPLVLPGAAFSQWIYRALVVLVISCPCALVISIPLGYFGGIGAASRRKVLVKGANFLDALREVTTVVFDKTGTLTRGLFSVAEVVPRNGYSSEQLLAWAAAAEEHSNHPIARSIRRAFRESAGAGSDQEGEAGRTDALDDVTEVKGQGVRVLSGGKTIIAGNDRLLHDAGVPHTDCDAEGTVVHVAVDGSHVGYIVVSDQLKEDAAESLERLKRAGVSRLVMMTGDDRSVAEHTASRLGISEFYAQMLPEQKVEKVEELKAGLPSGERLAFVGDGINDAPVLMRADVGMAMGDIGSDAAIEAADIVLQTGSVEGVPSAFEVARSTRHIVLQNIVFAVGVKLLFLALGAVGVATMWEAVIADMGVALLAVLNATRVLGAGRGRPGTLRRSPAAR